MANYDLTYEGSRVQNILDTGDELRDAGYIFRGEATPSTVPGTPTERVAYIGGPGTYTNFGSSITVGAGCICVFKYTGSAWSNQVINTGLSDAISSEATTRSQADTALQNAIDSEASARQLGDSTLQGGINTVSAAITAINNAIGNGSVYAGIATPSSTPASGKVFYLAFTAGTYTNFNNLEVPQGINILKNNGSTWLLDSFLRIDDAPTQGSDNLVKSGGISKLSTIVLRDITDIFLAWGIFDVANMSFNVDGNYRHTGFINIENIKRGVYGNVNLPSDRKSILYFASTTLSSYISGEDISLFLNIPNGAKYAIIQKSAADDNIAIYCNTNVPIAVGEKVYALTQGCYNYDGTIDPTGAWRHTNMIDIVFLKLQHSIFETLTDSPLICFFDASENFISSYTHGTPLSYVNNADITIPSNAKYFVINTFASLERDNYLHTASTINISELSKQVTEGDFTTTIQEALDNFNEVIIDRNCLVNGTVYLNGGNRLHIQSKNGYLFRTTPTSPILISAKENANKIEISGGVIDGNSYRPYPLIEATVFNGRIGLIDIYKATNVVIKDIIINNAGYFAIELTRIENLIVDNIEFYNGLQDGIHLNGGVKNFIVQNIYGDTSDDTIALNAWDWRVSSPEMGNIENGVVRNIHLNTQVAHGIRLLGAIENNVEYTVKNVSIENIFEKSHSEVVYIAYQADASDPSRIAQPASFYDIAINNIFAYSEMLEAVKIYDCNIRNISISNIVSYKNKGVLSVVMANIDNLIINNYNIKNEVMGQDYSYGIAVLNSTIYNLNISDIHANFSNNNEAWIVRFINTICDLFISNAHCLAGKSIIKVENVNSIINALISNIKIDETLYIVDSESSLTKVMASNIQKETGVAYYNGSCQFALADYTIIN